MLLVYQNKSKILREQEGIFRSTKDLLIVLTSKGKVKNGKVLNDGKELEFVVGRIPVLQKVHLISVSSSQLQLYQGSNDLGCNDSDCDKISIAKSVLMANLSSINRI
ncbi:hypothetical protein Tco_0322573 [Tanacetum coccineum]